MTLVSYRNKPNPPMAAPSGVVRHGPGRRGFLSLPGWFFGLLALTACAPLENTAPPAGPIAWRTLEQGRAEAKARNLPVLVDFYFGPECHRCARLDREVYADPEVAQRIVDTFVPVRIDLTGPLSPEEQKLEAELQSRGECALAFLDANGRLLTDRSGRRLCTMATLGRREFIEYLDRARQALEPDAETPKPESR